MQRIRDSYQLCSYAWKASGGTPTWRTPARAFAGSADADKWRSLVETGHDINPCGSKFHPAVQNGLELEIGVEQSLQKAYTPHSECFGCGPSCAEHGLHLSSYRSEGGLTAPISIPSKFCAFPGIVNGGVISTLLDCHGNWTAAIEIMDRSCLPKPPFTMTYSILCTYREPTPPDTPLTIHSAVTRVYDSGQAGIGKMTVEVDMAVTMKTPSGGNKVLVTAAGIFKKLGALRAL